MIEAGLSVILALHCGWQMDFSLLIPGLLVNTLFYSFSYILIMHFDTFDWRYR